MNDLHAFVILLLRRWRIAFWTTVTCLCIALIMAYRPDPIYRSSGTILSERPEISSDLAGSTVEGLFEQRIQLIRRRVITGENLRPIIERYNLYPRIPEDSRTSFMKDAFSIEQVDPITLKPSEGSDAFNLYFDYRDPDIARNVAEDLINLFLEDNRRRRTETARDTERFFANETARLAAAVNVTEDRLAEFKTEYQGLLPDDIERNKVELERISRELPGLQASIRDAQGRRDLLEVRREELSGENEATQLRTELALALQKYSEDHPDVRRLRRSIAALESGEELGTADVELRRVLTQIQAVNEEINANRQMEQRLRARIRELQGKQSMAPEIEKKLLELVREHDIAFSEYSDIRERRTEAEIATSLEAEDKGERYSMIRQPSVPRSPHYPNRVGIILIGLMFAFGGSAGLIALREKMDATVRGTHDVAAALEGPPIAAIPIIRNAADIRERFWMFARHGAALVAVTIGTYAMIALDF